MENILWCMFFRSVLKLSIFSHFWDDDDDFKKAVHSSSCCSFHFTHRRLRYLFVMMKKNLATMFQVEIWITLRISLGISPALCVELSQFECKQVFLLPHKKIYEKYIRPDALTLWEISWGSDVYRILFCAN